MFTCQNKRQKSGVVMLGIRNYDSSKEMSAFKEIIIEPLIT